MTLSRTCVAKVIILCNLQEILTDALRALKKLLTRKGSI